MDWPLNEPPPTGYGEIKISILELDMVGVDLVGHKGAVTGKPGAMIIQQVSRVPSHA